MPAVTTADHRDVRAELIEERARVLSEIAYTDDDCV
jgi:hypothetical protein